MDVHIESPDFLSITGCPMSAKPDGAAPGKRRFFGPHHKLHAAVQTVEYMRSRLAEIHVRNSVSMR
jgi:hypothetical protein